MIGLRIAAFVFFLITGSALSSADDFVRIPAGSFDMGCTVRDPECHPNENPRHAVTLSHDFLVQRTEVTVAAYRKFCQAPQCEMPPAPEFDRDWAWSDHPIVNVTWDDARRYCASIDARLPTEAEWEYAARGSQGGWRYPWGNQLTHDDANFGTDQCCKGHAAGRDRWEFTAPVASFSPNGYGLFDMAGNVWEWIADWYDEHYYEHSAARDPRGPATGEFHLVRGGSWTMYPRNLRVTRRPKFLADAKYWDTGFRCVRDR